jgi:ribosomal protein L34E
MNRREETPEKNTQIEKKHLRKTPPKQIEKTHMKPKKKTRTRTDINLKSIPTKNLQQTNKLLHRQKQPKQIYPVNNK